MLGKSFNKQYMPQGGKEFFIQLKYLSLDIISIRLHLVKL